MDFEIPDEYRDFASQVRLFRERELDPLEHDFLVNGGWPDDTRGALERRARELGFWALDVPTDLGGQGISELGMVLVFEELYQHPGMFHFGGSPEPSLYLCDDEQRKAYLLPVIEGTRRSCYAFTEPGTGSDLAGIRTKAERLPDRRWRITGTKTFISDVSRADFVITFATTDQKLGRKGVTCFLVDMSNPGVIKSRPIPTMGDNWEPYELVFQDCVVEEDRLLGEVNGAWKIAESQLVHGRLRIAAYQLGIARRAIETAVRWSKDRVTFGEPIANRQAIQWMLADSHVELEAARLLTYRAAWLADKGRECKHEAFVAKLYSTEMSQRVTDRCLQILGGLGYTRESVVQSLYRQARLWRIGHGTSEIARLMIARKVLQGNGDA
jgi:acyl-CoA dehydrogenase